MWLQVKRDTQVRYQGGVKSPILTEVKKNDKVRVIEDEGDWKKVRTEDGFIGYIAKRSLKDVTKERFPETLKSRNIRIFPKIIRSIWPGAM